MNKPLNVAQKLIKSHLLQGEMTPGSEIGIKIDSTALPGRKRKDIDFNFDWQIPSINFINYFCEAKKIYNIACANIISSFLCIIFNKHFYYF